MKPQQGLLIGTLAFFALRPVAACLFYFINRDAAGAVVGGRAAWAPHAGRAGVAGAAFKRKRR